MESLDRMANNTRTERLTIGAGTEGLPWVTPGQVHTQSRLPTLFPFQRRLLRLPLLLSLSLSLCLSLSFALYWGASHAMECHRCPIVCVLRADTGNGGAAATLRQPSRRAGRGYAQRTDPALC